MILKEGTYEKIKKLYWVSADPKYDGGVNSHNWFGWKFGIKKPKPVPNPNHKWRHPHYDEACRRQEEWDHNRNNYDECIRRYG